MPDLWLLFANLKGNLSVTKAQRLHSYSLFSYCIGNQRPVTSDSDITDLCRLMKYGEGIWQHAMARRQIYLLMTAARKTPCRGSLDCVRPWYHCCKLATL